MKTVCLGYSLKKIYSLRVASLNFQQVETKSSATGLKTVLKILKTVWLGYSFKKMYSLKVAILNFRLVETKFLATGKHKSLHFSISDSLAALI